MIAPIKPGANTGVTISTTSTALPTPPIDASGGIIRVETADVRMRWDSTDPVAGVLGGLLMENGSSWEIEGRDLFVAMRFIRNAAADARVNVAYTVGS